jgi:2-oxoglutarate/2-oxoacid ferredoxin oxidoreductase subunit beta
MNRTLQDYKSSVKPIWCPGCGNYGVFKAIQQAFFDMDLTPENIAMISGIGCSGRISHFFNTYSLHGTHGRAVPTATGVKTARPDLTVLAVGGDGDGLSIGGGHIAHAARKNTDITYILLDNQIYGLTKGQASPTTPLSSKTKTSPFGVTESPMDAIPIFIAYEASFVARGSSLQVAELTDLIKQAIAHKGFSIVYVMTPCVTYPFMDVKTLKSLLKPLPAGHDAGDRLKAIELGYSHDPLYTGLFYRIEKPTIEDTLENQIKARGGDRDEDELDMIKKLLYGYT